MSVILNGNPRISEHFPSSLNSFKRLFNSPYLKFIKFFFCLFKVKISCSLHIASLMLSKTAFLLLRAVPALPLASVRCKDIHGELFVIFISPSPPVPSVICKGNGLAYCIFPKWPDVRWPQSHINVLRLGMDRTVSDSLAISPWWL